MISLGGRRLIWGCHIDELTLRVTDPVGRGFIRPAGEGGGVDPRTLMLRPLRGREHLRMDALRRADSAWLSRWEATLPPDAPDRVPDIHEYVRRVDREQRRSEALVMGVYADERIVGQFSVSNVRWGAMSCGMLGYWVRGDWAGRGVGSLCAALVLDLVIGELGVHRVEVCVRPENERSLGVCRGLGLYEEGLRPRYMHINGQWADHVAFSIDAQSLPEGGLVMRKWGVSALD